MQNKKKWLKIICLSVGLVGTIGFGSMWGISTNQTYQFESGTIKGIGSNNYNCTWDKNNELQVNVEPFSSYHSFIEAFNKSSNKSLKDAINLNYNLWITGIVLTSIAISLVFGNAIALLKDSKKSLKDKSQKETKTKSKEKSK